MSDKLLNYFNGDSFAASTWQNKYALKDNEGNPIEETPEDMHHRLAREFARIENTYNDDDKLTEEEIFELFKDFKYVIPGGSVLSGLGSKLPVSLSNCFVIESPNDSYDSIMTTRNYQCQLMKRRGGCIEENTSVIIRGKGIIPIKDVKVGDEILSFNIDTREDEWKKVLDWYYTEVDLEDQIEVVSECGVHLKTSKKHPMLSLTKDGYDYISYSNGGLLGSTNKKPNLKSDFTYNPQSLDRIGWFIGAHMGDGSCGCRTHQKYNKYRIRILGDNENVVKTYSEIANNILGSQSKYSLSNRKSYKCQVWEYVCAKDSIKECVEKYFDNQIGLKTYTWHIPTFIKQNDLFVPFLAGLIDADGYICKSGRIDIALASEIAVNEIAEYLALKGQPYTVHIYHPKKENCNTMYKLHISKEAPIYDVILQYIQHTNKKERMMNKSDIKQGFARKLTLNEIQEITSTKCLDKENFKRNNLYSANNHNVKHLGKIGLAHISLLREDNNINDSKYNEILSRTKIKDVIIDNKEKFAYIDINVEGNNNYYAGKFGFINIHNCGYDLSELRPRGARVNNAAVTSTGAASFMEGNSAITNEVAQSGRRGALMLSISIVHPDIEEFIEKKQDLTKVTGANISVKVNNAFMKAVENDSDFLLRFPIDIKIDESKYMTDEYPYDVLIDISDNEPTYNKCYIKKVNAKRLWEKLTHCAWNTAEPGVIFEDRMHDYAPDGVYENYKMVSTNPCVAGDTIIKTNVGEMTIKELVDLYEKGHSNFMVESWNLNRYIAEMQTIKFAVLTQRDANLLKIKTESGNEIRVTQDHMIYVVKEGYQEAKTLKEGNELLVFDKKNNVYTPSKIISIIQDGIEDVYDIGVEFNHNFFANGVLVHNCGEIGMNKDSCRLIAMNLSGYVEKPYTSEAKFNFELFKNHAYKTLKLGDDLVDLELEQVNKILSGLKEKDVAERDIWSLLKGTAIDVRRMGLGFTGLGDMFAMMGIKYGSDESLEFIDVVLDVMFKAQLEGTIKLAKSRGKFNKFNAKLEGGEDLNTPQNSFFKMIHQKYPELWNEMMIHGRRNISWSTLAPCGTLSIMTRTTSGVEPLFMPFYERKRKCVNSTDRVDYVDKVGEKYTLFVIVHNGLKQWAHINKGISMEELDNYNIAQWQELYEQSPYFGACAQELDWHTRNSMQGAIQNYITHSISSCVTEDTLIVTDKGLMYLDELCNVSNISENTFVKNEDKVNVFSHDKKMHLISSYYNNGVKDVYELELANGLILRCTNNEKFLKYDDNTNMVEWKELKTLESGDLIEIF